MCTIINDTLSDGLNVEAWRASVVSPETGVPEQTGKQRKSLETTQDRASATGNACFRCPQEAGGRMGHSFSCIFFGLAIFWVQKEADS